MNYANTAINKTALHRGNDSSGLAQGSAWLYRGTAAIDRIDLIRPSTSNFIVGSTFTLYGIAAA
jgi:hypothetical protein